MKKYLLALMMTACLFLTGCGQTPPASLIVENTGDSAAVSASPDESNQTTFAATLYFRYGETSLLRQETREISVLPNETKEKALVSALIAGSQEGSTALFPEKTQVLSTQTQGDLLYVTFNEALYDAYGDEGNLTGQERSEALLRRHLAMAALCATLTESGEYSAVQVLVRPESTVTESMRLKNTYFLTEDETVLPPLTRESNYLPTPAATVRCLLTLWRQRDFEGISDYMTREDEKNSILTDCPALISASLTEGCVSPDGQSAIVCVDATVSDASGLERTLTAYPLLLTREEGIWKVSAAALSGMMQEEKE